MYGQKISKLQELTPQEYYSGGGLGHSNPAATTNDLTSARTDPHSNCTSEFSPPPATVEPV
ncbi:hypothetical protein K3495_g7957 [Podosphaera aphanis]|nr:hypothetical protein K3495_g7957 [Podosphaera aphanis]